MREFENFNVMTQAPDPALIRARGDRRRRRHRGALAALSLAALIGVGATPLALSSEEPLSVPVATGPSQSPEPAALATLTIEDLPGLETRMTAWMQASTDTPWACAPAGFEDLDSLETASAQYGAKYEEGNGVWSRNVSETVLRFGSEAEAEEALEQVQMMLVNCEAAQGLYKFDGAEEGRTVMQAHSYAAPEACEGDCDATWFDYMGAAQRDEYLVIVSYRAIAGPMPPKGPMRNEFFTLLDNGLEKVSPNP